MAEQTQFGRNVLSAIVAGAQAEPTPELREAEDVYRGSKAVWSNDGYEVARAFQAGWYARGVETEGLRRQLGESEDEVRQHSETIRKLEERLAAIQQVADGASAAAVLAEIERLRRLAARASFGWISTVESAELREIFMRDIEPQGPDAFVKQRPQEAHET